MNKFVVVQKVSSGGIGWQETVVDPILFRGNLGELREFFETQKAINSKTFCGVPYFGQIIEFYTLDDWFDTFCANK